MTDLEEDCIWVRFDVWLVPLLGVPVRGQTRKICRSGALVETENQHWLPRQRLEILLPEPAAGQGSRRVSGTLQEYRAGGLWIAFDTVLRSAAEMLMRTGLDSARESERTARPWEADHMWRAQPLRMEAAGTRHALMSRGGSGPLI